MKTSHNWRAALTTLAVVLFALFATVSVFASGAKEQAPKPQPSTQQSTTPSTTATTPAPSAQAPAASSTQSVKPQYTLRFATVAGPQDQQTLSMNEFAKVVNQISNGAVKVDVFPSGQLADQNTEILDVANGSIDMGDDASPSWFAADANYPEIAVLEAPYLYSSLDEMYRVLLGPVGQQYWNTLEQKSGIKVLDVWYLGTRELDLTASAGPITTPQQMRNVKLRMPNTATWLDVGRSLGANATPLDFGEVYLALKTGTIQGQDNPVPTDMTQKFFEVTKYLVLTNHMIGYVTPMINAKLWNSMPPEIQRDITTAMQIARDYNNYHVLLAEQLDIAKAEQQYGIKVIIPDQKAFMDYAKQYYSQPKFDKMWGPGVYAKIQALGE